MHLQKLMFAGLLSLWALNVSAGDYSSNSEVQAFIQTMVDKHGFDRKQLQQSLDQAEKKQAILDAIARPAEKTKPWYEYRAIFLKQDRIEQGVNFWRENAEILAAVSEQYGVEPEIIIAIIGVETRYGRYMGSYRVLDALATLSFDYPPRAKFFRGQLEEFFLLTREQSQPATKLMGSYAGAMGFGQFIPSSYRHYAKDHDKDGFADIWENKADAIASVANYFKVHGWQRGERVMAPAKATHNQPDKLINKISRPELTLSQWRSNGVTTGESVDDNTKALLLEFEQPDTFEYMLGFNNFYVITRYNRSHMYARAVWELSQAILSEKNKSA